MDSNSQAIAPFAGFGPVECDGIEGSGITGWTKGTSSKQHPPAIEFHDRRFACENCLREASRLSRPHRVERAQVKSMNTKKTKALLALSLSTSLAACATFPSSGPTGAQIQRDVARPQVPLGIKIIEVNNVASLPPAEPQPTVDLPTLPPTPTDMVGPGDVLGISIYEAGVTLFGRGPTAAAGIGGAVSGSFDTSANAQTLPPTRIDDNGNITVPYAGRLHVAGKTVGQIQTQIRDALNGMSQNPQVLVSLRDAISNTVIVGGEVARPGRLVLQTNRETLIDAIALAGGYRGNAKDLTLRINRQDHNFDIRYSALEKNPALDVGVYPGDRLTLVSDPQSYSVLGASGRVDLIPFSRSSLNLAEAVSTAGGSNPNAGDPAAIFLLRYVTSAEGHEEPVVYHLNMMNVGSYFLAGRFPVRNKDILYFGNSKANQASKVASFVSQLFSPVLTVVSGVQALK
ncbi:polysaccharide export protein [Sphingomonas sp. QA11]|uniref:polysaccharide biosynthesis/export family protein n=1 Tax=Sphingomonas sp. QA11 TaxID=2950605 RepID=UPI0023490AAE|nr:polysaccharide biosynthesis/export family protein [Sphingomonas sp. QA11]WCM25712.1 polysaccharide export protein [Sphingomonas sp. QA11]